MAVTEKKSTQVASLVSDLKGASAIYLFNYTGITVDKDNALRKKLRLKGIKYRAVKNTMLQLAFNELGIKGLDSYLVGATSVMIGTEDDPMLPAKEIVEFFAINPDVIKVKGVTLDGEVIQGVKIEDIAKMPGRKELIAQVVSMILGPGSNLVAILKGPGAKLAGAVKALEEKLEKASV